MTTNDEVSPTQAPKRLPTSTLLMAAGGLLLIIGAFLPWVSVAVFGISGVDAQWGVVTLLIGVAALVAALGAGRVFDAGKASMVAKVAAGLGLVALAIALYVGFAIRDSIAEEETGSDTTASEIEDEDLGELFDDALADLEDALRPSTGVGVYSTALGGVLVLAGGAMAARRT